MSDEEVHLPPTFKERLTEILAHAASSDRTVLELQTKETDDGTRHFHVAMDVTDYVDELEAQSDDLPDKQ